MAVLCRLNPAHGSELLERVVAGLPKDDVRVWPDVGDPAAIDVALIHRMPHGFLAAFPNLRLVSAVGAGVDHFTSDPDWPEAVKLVRITHADFASGMADYVHLWVLFHQRGMPVLLEAQRHSQWAYMPTRPAHNVSVGVLGAGQMGSAICDRLAQCGYDVHVWSRTAKQRPSVTCHHDKAGLDGFLDGRDVLVNVLPLTPETRGILNAETFGRLRHGAVLINAGRGEHLVDTDLISALASGTLGGATLDAANVEPLPPDHAFWTIPNLFLTPHSASTAPMKIVAETFVENIRRMRAGEPLLDAIDISRGY